MLLDPRENTFSVVVNRASSIVAGVLAAIALTFVFGASAPRRGELVGAVVLVGAMIMITGDHAITARSVARELGILREGEDAEEVVHARATPEDEIPIGRSWKERGEIVAMTGDGVNDAPALREAHIGIAMGRTGTEVAREALVHDSRGRRLREHRGRDPRGAGDLREHSEGARLPPIRQRGRDAPGALAMLLGGFRCR